MQERHDNDEIESHNHNEYPLLYKEAEISTSSLGKFLECRKCYILLVTCALVIYLICMPLGLRAYISGKSLVLMLQLLHTYIHTYIHAHIRIYIHTYMSFFLTTKVINRVGFLKLVLMKVCPLDHGVSFHPSLPFLSVKY